MFKNSFPLFQIYLFTGKKGPLLVQLLHIALSQNVDYSGVKQVTYTVHYFEFFVHKMRKFKIGWETTDSE